MISFQTSRFGSLEVAEDKVINFSTGLLGFPELRRYILMDHKDTPLKWLQAVDDPDVAFIVAEPGTILSEFKIELDDATRRTLELERDEDLAVLVILRVEGKNVIANLDGPLAINSRSKKGLQAILTRN